MTTSELKSGSFENFREMAILIALPSAAERATFKEFGYQNTVCRTNPAAIDTNIRLHTINDWAEPRLGVLEPVLPPVELGLEETVPVELEATVVAAAVELEAAIISAAVELETAAISAAVEDISVAVEDTAGLVVVVPVELDSPAGAVTANFIPFEQ